MNRYFKYLLLALFIFAVLLIVFLQFNSSRSINQLINGNENLLKQTEVKNNLQQLENTVSILESKVRGAVISGTILNTDFVDKEVNTVKATYKTLLSLQDDSMIAPLLIYLDKLLQTKIEFNKNILVDYSSKGKVAAEQLINLGLGTKLTDSIKITTSKINDLHQVHVTKLIQEADSNGRNARTLGTMMAVFAALSSIFIFIYVVYKVRQQQQLIERLNISEKKANDAVLIKENFLANMSHEIRTPMNAILGFTNLLQREQLTDKSKGYVQTIQRSSENLLTIINDILDLSKIEAGMMRIEPAPFSVRALLHSIEEMFQIKAKEKGLQWFTHVDNNLPDMLEGDALRLTQILINLIGNALKFTNSGNISVLFKNLDIVGDIVYTSIEVKDEGIGIETDKLEMIFSRFQQAEESVTRKYGGTGLGLAIVQDLVKLQNGSIVAESKLGKGTTFKISIPYKISAAHVIGKSYINSMRNINKDFGNIKVLVAEDNEINQSLIENLFTEWNILFDLANNGKEAVELLKKNKYNLILMDMQMPVMDGYTAALTIRNDLKLTIPIIAMTAHAMAGEREKCLSYGMSEYISKPIKEEQLRKLIHQFTKVEITKLQANNINYNHYHQYINLTYMKEVSMGNIEYEKIVTEQFIEAIPQDLASLKKLWEEKNVETLKQLVHNMKTTVSIMGLNEILNPHLDTLEHEQLTTEIFDKEFIAVDAICKAALAEAKELLATF